MGQPLGWPIVNQQIYDLLSVEEVVLFTTVHANDERIEPTT